jgi:hypothetical protein
MMVYFRKRFDLDTLKQINENLVVQIQKSKDCKSNKNDDDDKKPPSASVDDKPKSKNKGKLLLDATCAPSDIKYPTDLGLLNESRQKLEDIIDTLYDHKKASFKKPRLYREVARKSYLAASKQRRLSSKKRRKAIRKQLGFVKRNLKSVRLLVEAGFSLLPLSKRQYQNLLVVSECYRQQQERYDTRASRIANRIVSIFQPHIRPIVRGKAGKTTEFGAKVSASLVNGYVCLETVSWESYNESLELIEQVERYKSRFGYYPESLHVDSIYRNKKNRAWCKEKDIRLSGPPLGRPKKNITKEEKKQAYDDQVVRNAIEGKFGQGKRRFGLGRIMAKLKVTSQSMIGIAFLVMNLERLLHAFFLFFLNLVRNASFSHIKIENYKNNSLDISFS